MIIRKPETFILYTGVLNEAVKQSPLKSADVLHPQVLGENEKFELFRVFGSLGETLIDNRSEAALLKDQCTALCVKVKKSDPSKEWKANVLMVGPNDVMSRAMETPMKIMGDPGHYFLELSTDQTGFADWVHVDFTYGGAVDTIHYPMNGGGTLGSRAIQYIISHNLVHETYDMDSGFPTPALSVVFVGCELDKSRGSKGALNIYYDKPAR